MATKSLGNGLEIRTQINETGQKCVTRSANSVVVLVFSAAVKGLWVLPSIEINMMLVVRTYISRGLPSVITLFTVDGEREGVGRGLVEMRSPKLRSLPVEIMTKIILYSWTHAHMDEQLP